MEYLSIIADARGDTVDLLYWCSAGCAPADVRALGSWPGASDEPEYTVYCAGCGVAMNHRPEDGHTCYRCPPVLINRFPAEAREHCEDCDCVAQLAHTELQP